jgi:hypothetical protein
MIKEKKINTAVENDIEEKDIDIITHDNSSDLIKAMEILSSNKNIESNTILSNKQVNALALMNWAAQVYDIDFFKHYAALFPRYRISGDDGRGRTELIKIAQAIREQKEDEHGRLMELLGRGKQ